MERECGASLKEGHYQVVVVETVVEVVVVVNDGESFVVQLQVCSP